METRERIRELRKNYLNLTQEEFAKKINISRSNLGNIESGSVNVTSRVINDICQTFGIDENWLRTGEGQMCRMLNTDNNLAIEVGKLLSSKDEWTKNAVVQFLKLSPEQRETIKNFILQLNPK